ncbi:hypothetical protein [Methylobacterium dankookense]|uniref:Uncharacterized protein n=1 Tax=Methylobacterium dankookense TaxID=560405 RepID=A0A564G597_9HYPH|nr:hypothetical protein [Methylobacterium dankookense]GJD58159.1 hypothetical protein IFDJLNFL_4074 [Methylobacterium dankookense]VUF15110.1 hypothetical protein MTDSW087_04843 [Methylobacterium dankookense]
MADFPLYAFTTQEDWYGELVIQSAEAGNPPVSLAGRAFEMPITPSQQGSQLIDPVRTLTMVQGGGLSFKTDGTDGTLVFRVPRDIARTFARQDYTADVLEVVDGERHLFLPVRIRYSEPSGLLSYLSRFIGAAVTFAARQQPIITPLAIAGRQGVRGNSVLSGDRAPVPADGVDGDFWIQDRSAAGLRRLMYGPKVGGAWPGTPWALEADTAVRSFATPAEALTATPQGNFGVAILNGQLAVIANIGGALQALPFVTSTDLDA